MLALWNTVPQSTEAQGQWATHTVNKYVVEYTTKHINNTKHNMKTNSSPYKNSESYAMKWAKREEHQPRYMEKRHTNQFSSQNYVYIFRIFTA